MDGYMKRSEAVDRGRTTSLRVGNTKDQGLQMTVGSRTAEQNRMTISCEVIISMDEMMQ